MHTGDRAEGAHRGNTANDSDDVVVSGRPHECVAVALVATALVFAGVELIRADDDVSTILATFFSGYFAASLLHELVHISAWRRGSTPAIYFLRWSLATRCLGTPVTRRRAILITLLPTLTLLPLTALGCAVLTGAARLVFVGALFVQIVGSGSDLVLTVRLVRSPAGFTTFVDDKDGWRAIVP